MNRITNMPNPISENTSLFSVASNNAVIIDNCVVVKNNKIISIMKIDTMKKRNKNFNPSSLRKISRGNRVQDNLLLSQLAYGNNSMNTFNTLLQ